MVAPHALEDHQDLKDHQDLDPNLWGTCRNCPDLSVASK